MPDVCAAVRAETLDLCDRLAPLTDVQWDSPSLCTEWRIRDVLAHVTAGAQGHFTAGAVLAGLLRHRFDYNRWIAADGREGGQQEPAVMLQALRMTADGKQAPSAGKSIRALMHLVIHGQDMCRPLGIHRDVPEVHLVPVADFVATSFIFRAGRHIAGLKLTATDADWSRGSGPEVIGPAEALVMAMAGRSAALDDLGGDGVPMLRLSFES